MLNAKEWNGVFMWAARALSGCWSLCDKMVSPIPNNLVNLGTSSDPMLCVNHVVG